MPVNIAGVAKAGDGVSYAKTRLGYSSPIAVGMDPSLTYKVDSIMNEAIAREHVPVARCLWRRTETSCSTAITA